jgi:lipopolysaccharide export system permease protein
MLFHSSIRKELSRSFGATLVVLVTIVMTMMLIRTLGQASQGSVNPSEVSLVLGFTMLGHLPTVLTMSLFIASVGTLSRMYLDSEMVIWLVSGRGLRSFLKPMLHFAWPMLLGVAVLVLLVWPWSNQQISDLKERFERRGDLERVSPGQFQESANGLRVFFIDKDSVENKQGKNVFISSIDHGKQAMTLSLIHI